MGGKAIDPNFAQSVMIKAGVKPLVPFQKNRTPWRSKCITCSRIVEPSYANVKNGHAACRYCAKGGVSKTEAINMLKELKVKAIAPYPGYKLPWHCRCLVCGKEIYPRLKNVSETKKACNYCNRRAVDPKDAEKIAKLSGAIPLVEYPGPGRWKSQCKSCKRIIYPTLRRMRNGQNPCGWCARVRIDPSEAKAAFLKVGLKTIGKYPGVGKPWDATCTNCGERVSRPLSRIQAGRYACPYCAGRKIKNSEAKAIMREAGAIPQVPYPGIYMPWMCKCSTCFREISPKFSSVRAGHSPCLYCSGKKVDEKTAYDFALTRGLKPLTKYPGATKRWKVKCLKCNRTSTASWVTMQLKRKNAGCSSCTEFGFKPLEPAYLYVITHKSKKAHKVGIGNTNAKRIERHLKNGWVIYKVLEFKKGQKAHFVEQRLVEWLRIDKQIGPAFRTGDGWTETVPSNSIALSTIFKKAVEFSGSSYLIVPSKTFKAKN